MQRAVRHRQRAVLANKGLNSIMEPSPRLLASWQFETTQGGRLQVNTEERDKKFSPRV